MDESQEGVAKVQIPQGACCPDHAFMAFVDKKFKVRGYQNVDIEFNVDRKEKPGDQKKVDIKNYSV
nr:hypothetical protein [Candidatus Sigynarchaeota archaeon]